MAADSNVVPVIIRKKRRQKDADGHHGGAWKVAYADFVTAMMAFFMLMWLLNATTEQQRKGIADYFSPTIPIARDSGGGDGALGGESALVDTLRPQRAAGGVRTGQSPPTEEVRREEAALRALAEALQGRGGESLIPDAERRHIVTRLTDEGLVVELFARPGAALHEAGEPTPLLRALAGAVARAATMVENGVAIGAHLPARPVVLAHNPIWSDSADRAQTLRRLLEMQGLAKSRVRRVTGHADREPAVANAMAVRNDRFEVIFLRETEG